MEEIIKKLLLSIEAENGNVEDILLKVAKEENLNNEEIQEIQDVFDILSDINSKAIDLEMARQNNVTRQEWVTNQLKFMGSGEKALSDNDLFEIQRGIDLGMENIEKNNEL